MKLMKHITIALVLCAIPAMAFGQAADCEGCSHQVPIYMGAAGLIATADGADMVNYKATCGNVTRTGEMMADDDGIVTMLLDGDLVCDDEDGTFELGPIMDGGWFWMHMGDNSGVGNLVANGILMNEMTAITDPGDSVEITDGAGASLLMHTSGRFGILPNILPEPPAPDATRCGAFRVNATTVSQRTAGCMMGDGSTMVRFLYDGSFGRTDHSVGSATLYRSTNSDTSVSLDLWTTGGIVSTDLTAAPAGTGYNGLGFGLSLTAGGDGVSATVGDFQSDLTAALGSANATLTTTAGDATDDPDVINDSDHVTITFESSAASPYCTATSSRDAVLSIKLVSDQADLLPAVKNLGTATAMHHGEATLTIKCPPPAASMGTELVPDNPFPTEQ